MLCEQTGAMWWVRVARNATTRMELVFFKDVGVGTVVHAIDLVGVDVVVTSVAVVKQNKQDNCCRWGRYLLSSRLWSSFPLESMPMKPSLLL